MSINPGERHHTVIVCLLRKLAFLNTRTDTHRERTQRTAWYMVRTFWGTDLYRPGAQREHKRGN